jgi:UDP-3-O-[3-hydroxymyristoyl] glucosamine N-acyltransferase
MKTQDLSDKLQGRHWGEDIEVNSLRRLDKATKSDLSLMLKPGDRPLAVLSQAGCLLISENDAADCADMLSCTLIVVPDFYASLQKAMQLLNPARTENYVAGVHQSAHVHPQAQLEKEVSVFPMAYIGKAVVGKRTRIMPFVFIDNDVCIGEDCVIGVGSVLMSGTILGNRVILKPGSVLGSDGFVYYPDCGQNIRILSSRCVELKDDVEIGANTCVDKGMLEDTQIAKGSKIDNLVQIGHDVCVGKNAVIVAQAGLAGHVTIGDETAVGGQAGIAPYRQVGQGARISATAGVFRDVLPQEIVSGNPALAHMDYLRASAAQKKLHAYQKNVRNLQKRVDTISESSKERGIY